MTHNEAPFGLFCPFGLFLFCPFCLFGLSHFHSFSNFFCFSYLKKFAQSNKRTDLSNKRDFKMKIYSFFFALFILLSSLANSLFGVPVVTTLSPNAGPSSGGQTVTITGSGFTGTTAVHFDGNAAPFIVQSDTSIITTTPVHVPQVVSVTITTSSGSSANTSASSYVYQGDWFAYIGNQGSSTASVINTASNTVIANPLVGSTPASIASTPDGKKIYVVNQTSNNVSVIDGLTNVLISTIPVQTNPTAILMFPNGTKAYVNNSGNDNVSVIDIASDTVIATIPVGAIPDGMALKSDGTRAYIINVSDASVSVIDTATNTVIATVPVGNVPSAIILTPDGTKAYVTNLASTSVSVIETINNSVIATILVGISPSAITITPDGTRAYVVNSNSANVSVIDTANNTVIATVPVGINPISIALTPDGTRAYVVNSNSASVSVIDTATNTVIATVPVGNVPSAIILTPDGTRAYVTNQNSANVSVIDTASNTVIATVPVGITPLPIAITPDQAPLANFLTTTNAFLIGTPIGFDASSSASPVGMIVNYFWSFGDGTTLNTTTPIVAHSYAVPGTYSVSLIVTNSAGTSTQQIFSLTSNNISGNLSPPILKNNGGPTAATTQLISILPGLPVITNVNPNFGPISGGTSVTITGLNFTGATAVLFGSTPAVSFIVNSDTSITAVSPPGVGTVDIRVITPSGISAITLADQFTYLAPEPPRDLEGRQVKNKFVVQTDIVNILTWKAPSGGITPVAYKIYRNPQLTKLAAVIPANDKLRFEDHNRQPGKTYRYFVVTVDEAGNESIPATVVVKGRN